MFVVSLSPLCVSPRRRVGRVIMIIFIVFFCLNKLPRIDSTWSNRPIGCADEKRNKKNQSTKKQQQKISLAKKKEKEKENRSFYFSFPPSLRRRRRRRRCRRRPFDVEYKVSNPNCGNQIHFDFFPNSENSFEANQ